ncbi:MAG: hypothetical protein GEV06_23530 [Luteitalea sp.]|nr:hypothetical protein [Luteitalea sp.]
MPRTASILADPRAPVHPATGSPSSCTCPSPAEADATPGIVWRGATAPGSLADIAAIVAPILWFSPDEPLRQAGIPIPAALPCDEPSERAVVYYQAMQVRQRGIGLGRVPHDEERTYFDRVRSLALKFFSYYPEDIGLGAHPHDLEAVELQVEFDLLPSGCRQIRVTRATGLAHGLFWYSNTLDVGADTRFPLCILVEEGKHASCPDRNADGYYTPGYDVTARLNDAWGVRDVMSTGRLVGRRYAPSMAKRRTAGTRLLPRKVPRCAARPPSSLEARFWDATSCARRQVS